MTAPITVRTYKGKTQAKASERFQKDAASMGANGYRPVTQSWADGRRTGAASFFVGLGVLFLLVGILFLPLWIFAILFLVIGLASGKGDGQLSVTYQRPDIAPEAAPTPLSALDQLVSMREKGLVTEEEFTAKRADLIARL